MTQSPLDLAGQVRYLKDVENLSFRQLAEELGIHRATCSKLYAGDSGSPAVRTRLLDPYRDLIAQWYQEHPSLKAIQIFGRLKQRQVQVGYTAVKDFTREFRKPKPAFYHTLEFQAGEESQVDWFFLNHPSLGKLAGFALVLSYSRYFFAHFFPRYSFEFFIEGHLCAFEAMGGLTHALRYDNLKSVVLRVKPRTFNPAFVDFAQYYGFEIRLCNVRRANEKGRIERAIRTVRETFCNTASDYQTLDALNKALQEWCDQKNKTPHRSTGKPPVELKKEERLKPLPQRPWRNCHILPAQDSSKTGLVTFDTNRYSIPEYLVSEPLTIHAFCDRLEIYDVKGNKIASHPRCFARHQKPIINPAHRSFNRISNQAKRERIYAVIKNLDPVVAQFLLLNEGVGEDPYVSAHSLFVLLKAHARATVVSAVKDALKRRLPRMKCISSLLSAPPEDGTPEVLPQRHELLELSYRPRPLEEYEK